MAKADEYVPLPGSDSSAVMRAESRIKHTTMIQLLVKAALGFFSPLSPVMQVGDVGLRQELQAQINKHGVTAGIQAFMDKHPDATPDTVFETASTSGAGLPTTKVALDWLDQHWGW
jgi:hypothetical protein